MRVPFQPVLLCLVFLCVEAPAQSLPDAGSLLRDRDRVLAPSGGPEVSPGIAAPAGSRQHPDRGPTIILSGIRFSGRADLLPEADRAAILDATRGRRLGFSGLQGLAAETTAALQRRGHLLAQAVLPPQDVTEGVVEISIVDGRLDELRIERAEGTRISDARVRAALEPLLSREGLQERDLEAALLWVNDLPGVEVRGRLGAGASAGAAALTLGVRQDGPVAALVSADTFGTPTTGRFQVGARVSLIDPTGRGERLDLDVVLSEGNRLGRAVLRLPTFRPGTVLSLDATGMRYRNTDPTGRSAGLRGSSFGLGARIEHDLIRSRRANLRINLGASTSAIRDDSAAGMLQDKRIRKLSLGISGDLRARSDAYGMWDVGLVIGRLDLSRIPGALAADAAGPRTQGGFRRVNATVRYVHPLGAATELAMTASGQHAFGNLDSSEKFSLGGPFGVRAWPVGEGKGDSGLLGTLELRHRPALAAAGGALELVAFVDTGRVRLNARPSGVPIATVSGRNSYGLSGAGIGVRWVQGNLDLRASWARALGGNPGASAVGGTNADGKTGNSQFWLAGALRF